jgi:hypothetical protein
MNARQRLRAPAARGRALLLTAVFGLAAGIGLGLAYAWAIEPVQYDNTAPGSLRADYKADYMRLVARAYAVEGDLARASARLSVLGQADAAGSITALAQRSAAEPGQRQAAQELAALAAALGAGPATPTGAPAGTHIAGAATPQLGGANRQTVTPSGPPTAVPSPTVVPTITPRLLPTRTPTPTPLAAFTFFEREAVCDPLLEQPLIQVVTQDAEGRELPGVQVNVVWDAGFDHFFTGLKPELGRGYGDFTMREGVVYSVHLAESPASVVNDIAVERCEDSTGAILAGSWRLIFRQP